MIYEGAFEQIRKRRLRVEPPPCLSIGNHSQKGVMVAPYGAATVNELFPKGTNIK